MRALHTKALKLIQQQLIIESEIEVEFDNATAEPPLQLAIEQPPESASDPVQPRNAKRPRPNPPPQSNPEPRALRARTQITSYASLTRRP